MISYSLSGSELNERIFMRTIYTAVAAAMGTAALVATLTLAGGSAANASTPAPAPAPAPAQTSCWLDVDNGESLCVPAGVNLISTVESETGYTIDVPAGTSIGGDTVNKAQVSASLLSTNTTALVALSALYDDINYGGGTYFMTGSTCGGSISNTGNAGWNDRASSFKSFHGCLTAIYQNINYGGTRLGYYSYKSSFGTMNDQASSWRTE
jgi:hypothetical protein